MIPDVSVFSLIKSSEEGATTSSVNLLLLLVDADMTKTRNNAIISGISKVVITYTKKSKITIDFSSIEKLKQIKKIYYYSYFDGVGV